MLRRTTPRARREVLLIAALAFAIVASVQPAHAVVGGRVAPDGRYPFQVSLHRDGSHTCGGTIIAQFWVLTAAHCVDNGNPAGLTVRVGSADYTTGRSIPVIGVAVHPHFDANSFANDAALLRLGGPANLPTVRLASAPDDRYEAHGTPVTTIGWGGEVAIVGIVPPLGTWLREVRVAVVGDSQCGPNDAATMVCAGALLKDSCYGDSGGPLLAIDHTGAWVQIGIVSHGFSCGVPGYPGVYAEVNNASIRNWIAATVV